MMLQNNYLTFRYTIKDLERISGIKAHTLRIWEQRYQLLQPERSETNIRYYSNEDLKKILNVALLNSHGVKISRISAFSEEELMRQVNEVTHQQQLGKEQYIQTLILAMVNLDEELFGETISEVIAQTDFINLITQVFYPFLDRIGVMWLVGTISPAQEHFISYLIRQKLIVAVDALGYKRDPNQKTFLLYLPQNELHEIGLLVHQYLIKQSGANVIYLGTSVPFEDLFEVCAISKPQYIVTMFTNAIDAAELSVYLKRLSETFSDKKILVSGLQLQSYQEAWPANMIPIKDVEALLEFLEKEKGLGQ